MTTLTPCLGKAIASARGPKVQADLQPLQHKIEQLKDLENRLLPIEAVAKREVEQQREKLEKEAQQLARQNATEAEIARLPYQVLDPSVFAFRDKKGMPRLAPFALNSPVCTIGNTGTKDVLPQCCHGLYEDVRQRLNGTFDKEHFIHLAFFLGYCIYGAKIMLSDLFSETGTDSPWAKSIVGSVLLMFFAIVASGALALIATMITMLLTNGFFGAQDRIRRREYFISARFEGFIPPSVREVIRKAVKSQNFSEVFILAEVPHWKVETRMLPQQLLRPIAKGDPLVVGWDGKHFRLILAFDTTTLEQLVVDEFATKV